MRGKTGSDTYLSKSALHATKKICFLQPVVIAANVMDFKPQPLHLFKIEVHREQLREDGVYTGSNHFCSVNLPNGKEVIRVVSLSTSDGLQWAPEIQFSHLSGLTAVTVPRTLPFLWAAAAAVSAQGWPHAEDKAKFPCLSLPASLWQILVGTRGTAYSFLHRVSNHCPCWVY